MSTMDSDKVNNIAHLARINIDATKLPEYANSLSNILHLVQQMDSLDTEGVTPMAHPLDVMQPLRSDAITEKDFSAALRKFAPRLEADLFLVPQVIE